ncbi:ABC transporter substrate-binding protein [Tomitella gaofuii]|uniref:ABC transporter substrate-binding protein n=1 Tax=Tomitella gaofuii TaxID=2760083 RepID=UPI0015FA4BD1|nr:ABC transporter substrate-binding protein [Tomitella gaofuii]
MKRPWIRSGVRLAAAGAAAALLVAGCASTDGGTSGSGGAASDGDTTIGFVGAGAADSGEPVDGGTLTFGSYSFPSSLDPTETLAAGSNGGTEMAAIYDTLVRTDPGTGDFVPQLAEKIDHNEDYTKFTLTLRDGVTFSDGTPFDSAAVKWSIDRFVTAGRDVAQVWADIVTGIDTPDPLTVEFTLNKPWAQFPVMLAMGPGMIVGQGSDAGGDFTPIGAGPYTLGQFAPSEKIVLNAREDYFAGKPHLDTVTFVPTHGAQQQLESLQSGQLSMTYINRDAQVIKSAVDAGLPGYLDIQGLGSLGYINQHEGRPGADVRVRKAIAYAVDPEVINQRVENGLGIADSAIVPESSRWYDGAKGVPFDPAQAKKFLDEAKADGYDGTLHYLSGNDPSARAAALAVQAQLNAIGFNVQIDYANSVNDLVRKMYVDHDFDMARSALQLMDDAPYLRLYAGMGSDSKNNAAGYSDPTMDELLTAVQTATDDDAKKAAIDEVQAQANETIPYAIWGPAKVLTVWNDDVHGVKRSADNIFLLDSVWVTGS